MQQTSALYKQILANPNHWFECSLVIGESGLLLDHTGDYILFGTGSNSVRLLIDTGDAESGFNDSQLISLKTSNKLFADGIPQCGCAIASEIDVEMLAPLSEVPRKARIVPFVRVTDGTNYSEWIQRGVYFVDTRETSVGIGGQNILKFHGYDSMVETDVDFPSVSSHDFPSTDVQIIQDIADYLKIDVDDRTWDIMTEGYMIGLPVGYSIREVLQQIAGAYCGNFIMNDVGQLRLVQLNEMPSETNLLIDTEGYRLVFGDPETIDLTFNQLNQLEENSFVYANLNHYSSPYYYGDCPPYTDVEPIDGHKYYVQMKIQNSIGNVYKYEFRFGHTGRCPVYGNGVNSEIWTCSASDSKFIRIFGNTQGETITFNVTLKLMDLTKMFGAGNEPTETSVVEEMFPEDYYEFDEGSPYVYLKGVRIIV